jgi:hypothetical protein
MRRWIKGYHAFSGSSEILGYGRATQMTGNQIIVRIPQPGERPSRFRREFILAIKTAVHRALRRGAIDPVIAEECWRALPTFRRRA